MTSRSRGRGLARAALAAGCALAMLAGGAQAASVTRARAAAVTRARWLMGTLWTATADLPAADTLRAADALAAALDTVAALEARFSNWIPASELCRLNAAGGGQVSGALFAVLDSARALAAVTGGAFDPTVEPLTLAWDLRGEGRIPSAGQLSAARARVGWRHVKLDRARSLVALSGTELDLGGIAKGFALDRAAGVLRSGGVETATLDAGGQMLLMRKQRVSPCSLWVAHPMHRDEPAVCLLLTDGSLSTSGQSEHTLQVGGRAVGHVLDPRTGSPVETHASVSVLSGSGTRADALSTALLVMGRDRALAFAEAHRDLCVLWLEPHGGRVDAYVRNLQVAGHSPSVTLHVPPLSRTALPQ